MAKKKTTITFRMTLEDKDFLKAVSDKTDITMTDIIVTGAIKEAKRLNKEK
jgi:uncharacterized protein (DUF1778 family)